MKIAKLLSGHHTFQTAYVIPDYPFGRRLRCCKAMWIERNQRGMRVCYRTTKKAWNSNYDPDSDDPASTDAEHLWNKEKRSVYYDFAVLFLDEDGHVQSDGVSRYSSVAHVAEFDRRYSESMTPEDRRRWNALLSAHKKASPDSWNEYQKETFEGGPA